MALYARHPWFTVTLLVLIFISLFMFASDSPLRSATFNGRSSALADTLALEEVYYNKMLSQRHELIKKWGPTQEEVNP
jgi:hypothetical protein